MGKKHAYGRNVHVDVWVMQKIPFLYVLEQNGL